MPLCRVGICEDETEDLAMDGENPAPEFDAGEIEQIAGVTDEDVPGSVGLGDPDLPKLRGLFADRRLGLL